MRVRVWVAVVLGGCGPSVVDVPRVDPAAFQFAEDVVNRVDALCLGGSEVMCDFLQTAMDAQAAYLQAEVGCRARGEAAACTTYDRLSTELSGLNQRLAAAQAGQVAPETIVAAASPRLAQTVASSGAL
jgi:hypothetical protein